MEALTGLLLIIGILGGGFLLLCLICFGIVYLLSFISEGKSGSDWIWRMHNKDKK